MFGSKIYRIKTSNLKFGQKESASKDFQKTPKNIFS